MGERGETSEGGGLTIQEEEKGDGRTEGEIRQERKKSTVEYSTVLYIIA
jgi:hypothetical protein